MSCSVIYGFQIGDLGQKANGSPLVLKALALFIIYFHKTQTLKHCSSILPYKRTRCKFVRRSN